MTNRDHSKDNIIVERSNLYNVIAVKDVAAAQAYDFIKFRAVNFNKDPRYDQKTLNWAVPMIRLDGMAVYPVCPNSDAIYNTEPFSSDWFERE